MTSIVKCGTTAMSPHVIYAINGVGVCFLCLAKFIDNRKLEAFGALDRKEASTTKG